MKIFSAISVVLLSAAILSAQNAPNTPVQPKSVKSSQHAKKGSAKKKVAKPTPVEPAPVAPTPPPPPPTLAQQPPVAPKVNFQNGLLSIDAPNSTLGDILAGIRRATGATIDGPANLSDRVVVHLGPGQPRDVMTALLGSSRFNYIVMGTPQQPNGISKIVLLARQGTNAPSPGVSTGNPGSIAPVQPQRPPVAVNNEADDEETSDRDENSDAPPSQPMVATPEQNPVQPQQMPPDQNGMQQPPADQNQNQNQANPNGPKTPEQLYKELQELERQRQQPQNQAPTNPR